MFPKLPNTKESSRLFEIPRQEDSKTSISSEGNPQEEKEKIRSGAELFELADSLYRCDNESMEKLRELVPKEEVSKVFGKDSQTYFLKAAENLSYFALAFAGNIFYAPNALFCDEFVEDSLIFQTFIEKLKERECTLEDFEIKRLLMALLKFNYGGTEEAVLNSGDARLIRVLYGIVKKHFGWDKDPYPKPIPFLKNSEKNDSSEEEEY